VSEPMGLPGVFRLTTRRFADERGFVGEVFRHNALASLGVDLPFVQVNHAHSRRGVLRGMHYQLRSPQGKLVSVLRGRMLDVVLEVRQDHPRAGEHVAVVLEEGQSLWVPSAYAHGFEVLSDTADVVYQMTGAGYDPNDQGGIHPMDPQLAIPWRTASPILSAKDAAQPRFSDALRPT